MTACSQALRRAVQLACAIVATLVSQACSGGLIRSNSTASTTSVDAATVDSGDAALQVLGPVTSARKVKRLLTGETLSADESSHIAANAEALPELVAIWMASASYQSVMTDFFSMAFQQYGFTTSQLIAQYFTFAEFLLFDPRLMANIAESFGRTAMQLVNNQRPFTDTMTTRQFMMTPPLMMLLAYADERHTDDNRVVDEQYMGSHPNLQFSITPTPIALTQSFNPSDPNYLTFYLPQLLTGGSCSGKWTFTKDNSNLFQAFGLPTLLHMVLNGQPLSYGTFGECRLSQQDFVVTAPDYNAWRMVTVRQPNSGEKTTDFIQYPALQKATELVLQTPKIGFYTTMAFLTKWNTNSSNQARVTINQALITALGQSFDGTHTVPPLSSAAIDPKHAPVGSACYQCHQDLDPMRQYYRQAFTLYFSKQTDTTQQQIPSQFAFDGVSKTGTGIADLGAQFAAHPRFAQAWTQKLCTWATGAPCLETDPEFLRLVSVFSGSNFNWSTLVEAMFTSPLVTYASVTDTMQTAGSVFPIAKQRQLCNSLEQSLGLDDPCGLKASTQVPAALSAVPVIASVLPADAYGRGSRAPTQANDPGLFFRSSLNNICAAVAQSVVEGAVSNRFSASDPNAAVASMVHDVMGLAAPDDAEPLAILSSHYANAVASGFTQVNALRSTFMLACLSPVVAGIGQ